MSAHCPACSGGLDDTPVGYCPCGWSGSPVRDGGFALGARAAPAPPAGQRLCPECSADGGPCHICGGTGYVPALLGDAETHSRAYCPPETNLPGPVALRQAYANSLGPTDGVADQMEARAQAAARRRPGGLPRAGIPGAIARENILARQYGPAEDPTVTELRAGQPSAATGARLYRYATRDS
jgi:hypothetical protein